MAQNLTVSSKNTPIVPGVQHQSEHQDLCSYRLMVIVLETRLTVPALIPILAFN
jgi:hypothetical protein